MIFRRSFKSEIFLTTLLVETIIRMAWRSWHEALEKGFPGGAVVKNLPANAGDTGLSPDLGRSHMPRSN